MKNNFWIGFEKNAVSKSTIRDAAKKTMKKLNGKDISSATSDKLKNRLIYFKERLIGNKLSKKPTLPKTLKDQLELDKNIGYGKGLELKKHKELRANKKTVLSEQFKEKWDSKGKNLELQEQVRRKLNKAFVPKRSSGAGKFNKHRDEFKLHGDGSATSKKVACKK